MYDINKKLIFGKSGYKLIVTNIRKYNLFNRMIESPGLMRELFLSAAHDFLECEHPLEAGKCLENAKEFSLAADLYRKTNMVTFSLYNQ